MNKNSYVEFNINGVIRVTDENKEDIIDKINSLVIQFIKNDMDLIRSEYFIDIISEEEIVQSIVSGQYSEEYDN